MDVLSLILSFFVRLITGFENFFIIFVKGEGESIILVPNMWAHSSELQLGSFSDEAAIAANQSSKMTLN
jgi:hypothetical protein